MRGLQVRSMLQPLLGQGAAAQPGSAPAAAGGQQQLPSLEGLVRALAGSAEHAPLARQALQMGSLQVPVPQLAVLRHSTITCMLLSASWRTEP